VKNLLKNANESLEVSRRPARVAGSRLLKVPYVVKGEVLGFHALSTFSLQGNNTTGWLPTPPLPSVNI
jgi:hypothetical protein